MDIVVKPEGILRYDVDKAADYDHKGVIKHFKHVIRIGGVRHEVQQVVMLQSGERIVLLDALYNGLRESNFYENVQFAIERICNAADINNDDFKLDKYAYNEGELCYEYDPEND